MKYDRLYYTEFTRIATLSPELQKLTLTVGSAGKTFSATGWRVGWLIGDAELIKYVAAAHTRACVLLAISFLLKVVCF